MASSSSSERRTARPPPASDYESDSEGVSALALRRREASDDEDDDGPLVERRRRGDLDAEEEPESKSRRGFPEDEGAPPEEEEEEGEEEEEASRSDMETAGGTITVEEDGVEGMKDGAVPGKGALEQESVKPKTATTGGITEQKKDAEPFVVPTAGAFYMHDDRFRDNGGPRSRRTAGGRRLWDVKDEKPWVHDRFEELNLNDTNFYGKDLYGKRGRGRSMGRGRGRSRGRVPRYSRGGGLARGSAGRYMGLENTRSSFSHQYGISGLRQGTRRSTFEEDTVKEISVTTNKGKAQDSEEMAQHSSSSLQVNAKLPETVSSLVAKPATSSTLNYASPPFYPSGSFQHHLLSQIGKVSQAAEGQQEGQGKDLQGNVITMPSNVVGQGIRNSDSSITPFHSSNVGYNSIPFVDVQNIHRRHILKTLMQQQQPSKANEKSHLSMEQPAPTGSLQQKNNGQLQPPSFNGLCMQQLPSSKQGQNLHEESQPSSENISVSSKLAADAVKFPSSQENLSKNIGNGRDGHGSPLELGRNSFGYSNMMGLTSGLRTGDPSFPSASTMVPIVQFSGRPQAGVGVPTVGVALPTYSGQPQFGFANSEVTWVPILAGGGSMGPAGYNSSYMTLDGSPQSVYYRQPTTQPASLSLPGQDPISAGPTSGTWKAPLKSEPGNEDFGQRQSKPRRYSEMNFGQ